MRTYISDTLARQIILKSNSKIIFASHWFVHSPSPWESLLYDIHCRFICWNTLLWNIIISTNAIPTTNVYPKGQMDICYVLGLLQQKGITPLDTIPCSLLQPYAVMLRSGGNNTMYVSCLQEVQTFCFQASYLCFSSPASFSWNRQVEHLLVQESQTKGPLIPTAS